MANFKTCDCTFYARRDDAYNLNVNGRTTDLQENRGYREIIFSSRPAGTTGYEFIDYTDVARRSTRTGTEEIKKKVKSTVMQNFRRNQKLEAASRTKDSSDWVVQLPYSWGRSRSTSLDQCHLEESPQIIDFLKCENCGNVRLYSGFHNPWSSWTSFPPNPISLLSAALTDPFDSLPLKITTGSYTLLNHFRRYQILVQTPVLRGNRDRWFIFALHNPAGLNASLVLAASHFMRLGGQRPDIQSAYYHHKVEAIRIINGALVDRTTAMSDEIISAVACLTISDRAEGNLETASVHLAGLERLLELRAKDQIGYGSPMLERLIILINSRVLIRARLPRSERQSLEIDRRESVLSGKTGQYPSSFSKLPSRVVSMLLELQRLTELIASEPMSSVNHCQPKLLTEGITALEFSIHNLSHNAELFSFRSRMYLIAGVLYICLFLRKVAQPDPIYSYYVGHLKESLETAKATELEHCPTDVMLWIVFLGFVASEGRKNEEWFKTRARSLKKTLNLRSWEDTSRIFQQISLPSQQTEVECLESRWNKIDIT
ncbi:hypothetical protein V1525DRAFT_435000 [Lipomyces kononenkoae]|uniref:Uncharacterized protein n=1 Tax=Lipomyces kononenkoae TaxID=34357 RepID=A0ACC3SU12_LIPKO